MATEQVYVFSDNILAPDGVTRVSGCKPLDRDLRRDRKALDPEGRIEAAREWGRERIKDVPTNKKWCSYYDHEGYDEHGQDDGGWVDKREFTEKEGTHDGLHPYCNKCRARHKRRMYALAKEAEGQHVRSYKRQLVQMTVGG